MKLPADPTIPLPEEPALPASDRPIVVLADTTSKLERRIVDAWVARQSPTTVVSDIISIRSSRRPRMGQRTDPRLHARLDRGDDPWVVPVRVVWLPNERNGRRSASLIDIVKLGDPRDPDPIREHVILSRFPHRVSLVLGAGARASELAEAHDRSIESSTFNDFVTRRAHRALERAEREVRGNRYKVPRFLHEEILQRSDFLDGVMRLASEIGIPPELALARSRYYLREIAASHKPFVIDLLANFIHWIYSQGYGEIIYDHDRLAEISELGQQFPIAFLPSHRSNMDRLTLQYLLWENDMPPNHTAAGINMNFFPIGTLIRNTGAFFIRRSFKENELYKYVLRAYLDYLVENRFPLEWYAEGGRSRSGKLLPPKLGMLSWVADSIARNRADDLYLVPTSIAYDQIVDVSDYASEARGGSKDKESASWAISKIMSLRGRYGNIHVRFAEPLSIKKELGADGPDDDNSDLQKLALEVMYRISKVTPITPTAVVSIALLSGRSASIGAAALTDAACRVANEIARSGHPTTEPIQFDDPRATIGVLEQLSAHGSVTIDRSGDGSYQLTPQQAVEAAYYRNTVVHFFVPGAIAELATVMSDPADGVEGFWSSVADLRDLLKFEFFFADRSKFRREIIDEMDEINLNWRTSLAGDRALLLEEAPLLRAHWALLPFLEAYLVVAEQLTKSGFDGDRKQFLAGCLETGKEWLAANRIVSEESVAKPLFSSALDLAINRNIVDATHDEQSAFATAIQEVVDAARSVGEFARARDRLL